MWQKQGNTCKERCRENWKRNNNNLVWNIFTCRKNMKRYKKRDPLFCLSFYFSLSSQELWFIHRWHHGDHSYFYWLVNGQLFSMLCHLSNPHQSTSPWERKKKKKKVNHPKMIESWKAEYDTCMPCYCPRHVSRVRCLVTATGSLSLFACVIHTPGIQCTVCPN